MVQIIERYENGGGGGLNLQGMEFDTKCIIQSGLCKYWSTEATV